MFECFDSFEYSNFEVVKLYIAGIKETNHTNIQVCTIYEQDTNRTQVPYIKQINTDQIKLIYVNLHQNRLS